MKIWNIYCSTEGKWYNIESKSQIFTCPYDAGHTIDRTSIQELTRFTNNEIKIQQEDYATRRYVAVEGITMNCSGSLISEKTSTKNLTWPIDIAIFSIKLNFDANNEDDILNIYRNPDTTVGVLTQSVSSSNVIKVSDTVIQNTEIGFELKLVNGGSTCDLGRIIDYDYSTNRITTENNVSGSFAAGSTLVKLTIHAVRNISLPTEPLSVGENFGSSFLPKGTVVKLEYTNKTLSLTAKKLKLLIAYFY